MDQTQVKQIAGNVLKDLFVVGVGAAAIFVKNPEHQVEAQALTTVLQQLLPLLEAQLGA